MTQFKEHDGATIHGYTDSKACTVCFASPKEIWIQRDNAILLNGADSGEPDALKFTLGGFSAHCSGVQRYRYERECVGPMIKATLRKNGKWILKGEGMRTGREVTAGRSEHYDYNF